MDDNFNNQNQQPEDNNQQPYQQDNTNQYSDPYAGQQYQQQQYNDPYANQQSQYNDPYANQQQQYNDPYANQQYPQYQQQQYNTYNETYQPEKRGFGIASMIIGICSILLGCCIPYVSFAGSIAGIILGIVSLRKNESAKGMAIAGIVTSGCALLLSIIMLIMVFIAMAQGNVYLNGQNILNQLY